MWRVPSWMQLTMRRSTTSKTASLCVARYVCMCQGVCVCVCVWRGVFVCGKVCLHVSRCLCVWQGMFACVKVSLCVARYGMFACVKVSLHVARCVCVWQGRCSVREAMLGCSAAWCVGGKCVNAVCGWHMYLRGVCVCCVYVCSAE